MDLFGSANKPANVNVKVTNEGAKKAVNTAGKTLKNSLATAQTVKNALLTVSTQLKDAANSLNANKAAVANGAADAVKANLPAVGGVFSQMGGSPATAALIGGMPKSVIAGGARRAVEEGVRQLKKLSGAAREGAEAINAGLGMVARGATYVSRNAKRVDLRRVNRALEGAGRVANNNVGGLANVNVSSNLNSEVNSVVENNAEEVAAMAAGFANDRRGSRKNSRRASRRNNRKNGGFANMERKNRFANMERKASRKNRKNRKSGGFANNSRKNSRKNERKDGGFFSFF
jgi:hypothetical protein